MKLSQIALIVVLSFAVAFATARHVTASKDAVVTPVKETRLEQVKRTGVLRCGYYISPPYLMKDPNTGKMSGVMADLLGEMGRQLNLKIDWVAEIGTGNMISDLNMNRYDAMCSIAGEMPGRAREGDFVGPITYLPVYLFVRKDDSRFDNNYARANNPDVTMATMDGEFSAIGASENFPAAHTAAVPQLSSVTDLYVMVATKKADAVVEDQGSFAEYDASNPGVLRRAEGAPVRVLDIGMMIPANEPAFKAMLNTTLGYLRDSGFVDKTLDKYETKIKSLRVAKPYAQQQP
ncbi:MAG: transporter substrate-binding domain-containing protein [Alphaproteobacteria bacterium]|nr:transporter substrate-binding domain-containing protein [Alphaproteobacteria bacterium]